MIGCLFSIFKDKTVDLNAIEQCIPTSVTEKKTELFWDYCCCVDF